MPPPRLTRDMRDALAVYGHLLLSARQMDKAHALFKGMRVLFPGDMHVTRNLAVTSLATGDAQSALAWADEARAAGAGDGAGDDTAGLDIVRSKALFALGRTDEARASLGRALGTRVAGRPAQVNGKPA